MTGKIWMACGALLGGLAVLLGAFGAHGLQEYLAAHDQTASYETGARYQMYHALALMLVGVLVERRPAKALNVCAWCFLAGTVVFCGSLYAISLTSFRQFGMVAPIGGGLFIVGWALLFVWTLRGEW